MLLAAPCALAGAAAWAAESIEVGLVVTMIGPFADYGEQISRSAQLYTLRNGDTIAGKKVELMIRDDIRVAQELTKQLFPELIGNEHVDVLAGFGLSPGALATAPLAT